MAIPWQQAQELVLAQTVAPGVEELPLAKALGRRLAAAIHADRDFPPTDRSAMDGFACRAADCAAAAPLRIVGEARAGQPFAGTLGSGQAISIMTGAVVPAEADTVVRLEDCAAADGFLRLTTAPSPGDNIRRRGEEASRGGLLLPGGSRLHPAALALAAMAGMETVRVCRLPKVAVVCTGSELAAAGPVRPEQLRDANGPALAAALNSAFGLEALPALVQDEEEALTEVLRRTLDNHDFLIVTGGVSVGAYDLVPAALRKIGAEILFHGVAVKPGKPQLYARLGAKQIFALSGNPLGVLVGLYLFVLPALRLLTGAPREECPGVSRLPLAQAAKGRRDRTELFLGRRIAGPNGLCLEILPCGGSADLVSAARADCFVIVEAHRQLAAGTPAEFIPWLQ